MRLWRKGIWAALLLSLLRWVGPVDCFAASKARHEKTYEYSDNVLFQGVYGTNSLYFEIPEYWNVQYVTARITYAVSPLITEVPANLTFYINGDPVGTQKVDAKDGSLVEYELEIPLSYLTDGYNEFRIGGYARLYDEEGCLDNLSGANWIEILGTSYLLVGYELSDAEITLGDYPYPFVSSLDETGKSLTVYLPDTPSKQELAAAFALCADLADETEGTCELQIKNFQSLSKTGNRIILSTTERLPESIQKEAQTALEEKGFPTDDAWLLEYEQGGGRTLIIAAKEEERLKQCVGTLLNADRISQEKDAYAAIPDSEEILYEQDLTVNALMTEGVELEELVGQDGLNFIGPFHQTQTIYLPYTGGFVLGEGGKITLKLRYSDNLDFDRSMITVYWGNTPIASKRLEQEQADGDEFSFLLPADVTGEQAGSITIAYDLELKELYCTKRADQMPWGYVSGDSSLYLPMGSTTNYSFAHRPYPFQNLGQFHDLALVVPETMTEEEYRLFVALANFCGTQLGAVGQLDVYDADTFPTEETDANIISLGTFRDNPLIQTLQPSLSISYQENGEAFADNEQVIFGETYARDIGVLQMIRSPYHSDRAILVACAADQEGIGILADYLTDAEKLAALSGDACIIDSDLIGKTYTFLNQTAGDRVTLREQLAENKEAVIFTLVSTAAMALLALAVTIIAIRYGRNKKNERKN